jgi:hypothetical protein
VSVDALFNAWLAVVQQKETAGEVTVARAAGAQ